MTEDSPYFNQDSETGKITQKYPDEAFIQAVKEQSLASTSEVGEVVGCSSDNAYRRLKSLEDAGKVESKKAGQSLVWYLPNG
ncbi:hypothetical protein SAMN05444422_112108 [Halobiforma haloterrestris]|uniref:Sugar-specific transcriptional regulator TrmB n=1 Tax=Natronobacterium haloterrestre TaxID=148448 RepID=A0A1I1KR68_NATHA|nr:hypothetical protein [Halobiforma haloterrestris]SFC63287.1 hypothetical protein SAMN05444422_112108 [Halobiforma haloterrestris]